MESWGVTAPMELRKFEFKSCKISLKLSKILENEDRILAYVVCISSLIIGSILMLIPYESIDGNPVPTIIFKGLPSEFHAFVMLIIFAFAASYCAILMNTKVKFARFCRYYSMISMASAFAIFISAMFRNRWISQAGEKGST